MTDKQIIIDDCIHLNEWKHCDICEKLIKTKDSANGKKREHLLTEEDLRCDFYPNCYYKQLKAKEQECEELKKELQAQRDFTVHEQKLIYCVAYDETCKTGNGCKQEKCIFKDNIKLKQALAEIKDIAEKRNYLDYNECLDHILQKISEVKNE